MTGGPAAGEPDDYPAAGRAGYELRVKTPQAPRAHPDETTEQRYLREIRNAVSFIAVVVGIGLALGLISLIVAMIRIGSS
jgi:hypothetical protein